MPEEKLLLLAEQQPNQQGKVLVHADETQNVKLLLDLFIDFLLKLVVTISVAEILEMASNALQKAKLISL